MKNIENDFKVRDEQGSQKKSNLEEGYKENEVGSLETLASIQKRVDYSELLRTPVIIQDNLLGGIQMKKNDLKNDLSKKEIEDIILGKSNFCVCPPAPASKTIVDEEEELSALELYEDLQY